MMFTRKQMAASAASFAMAIILSLVINILFFGGLLYTGVKILQHMGVL